MTARLPAAVAVAAAVLRLVARLPPPPWKLGNRRRFQHQPHCPPTVTRALLACRRGDRPAGGAPIPRLSHDRGGGDHRLARSTATAPSTACAATAAATAATATAAAVTTTAPDGRSRPACAALASVATVPPAA